jgi:hypothetical protein
MAGSSWIDDCLKEREKLQLRTLFISNNAERVFEDLWAEMRHWIDVAKSKKIPVSTNGSPYERIVKLNTWPDRDNPTASPTVSVLTIKLVKEKEEIEIASEPVLDKREMGGGTYTVSGGPRQERLLFDLCEDNVVCLKLNGKQLSIHDAAIAILRPFLFPELSVDPA